MQVYVCIYVMYMHGCMCMHMCSKAPVLSGTIASTYMFVHLYLYILSVSVMLLFFTCTTTVHWLAAP